MKRIYSLKRNKEFRYVYKTGRSSACKSLVLVYRAKPDGATPRIGFSVSKKIGGAVVRNRVKRRLRAAITPYIAQIKPGSSLIFIARDPILDASFDSIRGSLLYLLKKTDLMTVELPKQTSENN